MAEDIKLNKIKPESFGDFDKVSKEFLPRFHINSSQIPEVLNWQPGKPYRLIIDLKQTDKGIREDKSVDAGFVVTAYKVIRSKPIEEMDDEEFGVYQGEQLAISAKSRESSLSINASKG